MSPLRTGSRGPEVTNLQHFLIGRGYAPGAADGDFGPKTHAAVAAYQRSEGLAADGIVGNITLGRMLAQGMTLMVTPDTDAPPSSPASVYPPGFPPRPDFAPLTSNAGRAEIFGRFAYVGAPEKGNPEAIRITDGWEDKNIVLFSIPQLKSLGISATGNVRCHRLVQRQTLALWKAWEDAGLLPRVKSWEGMYVPRFIRGSRVTLSNHAFGSAFDVNYEGNELGRTPAAVGKKNSVRELVPIAHEHGFYWGGHFSRADGMHFEVAQVQA